MSSSQSLRAAFSLYTESRNWEAMGSRHVNKPPERAETDLDNDVSFAYVRRNYFFHRC